MFQIHGWIEILRTTTGEEDLKSLERVAQWLNHEIAASGLAHGLDVEAKGGAFLLRACFVQNRDRSDSSRTEQILTQLGEMAPGSYGLFFVRDDDHGGSFRVLAMRRGRVTDQLDEYLSPIVPAIEDP